MGFSCHGSELSCWLQDDRRGRRQLSFGLLYHTVMSEGEEEASVDPAASQITSRPESTSDSVDGSSASAETVEPDYTPDSERPTACSTQHLIIQQQELVQCGSGGVDLRGTGEDDSTLTETRLSLDEPDNILSPQPPSPRKLSRGRVIVGHKPVVMIHRHEDNEDLEEGKIDEDLIVTYVLFFKVCAISYNT